jgi:hypothetical protein
MHATQLHLIRWVDPAVDEPKGLADPATIFWLTILGPPAFVLLMFLQASVDADPRERTLNLDLVSQLLGLGTCDSKHAPIFRAISRLVHFGLAKRMAAGQLAVRSRLTPPTPQQLSFLRRERAGDRDLPASAPSPRANPTTG